MLSSPGDRRPHQRARDRHRTTRRFAVYGCRIDGDVITPLKLSEEPVEELALPLTREAATAWLWEHCEDLGTKRIGELVARLVRPTGPLGGRG